jgi:hypothetical protein
MARARRSWASQVEALAGSPREFIAPMATPSTRVSKTPAKRADQVTKTTSNMNNTSSQQTTPQQSNRPATRHAATSYVDLSRGATEFGISGQTVRLDADVIEGYAELDSALGRNVGGVVLSVLSRHLAAQPGGFEGDIVTACLLRREDAEPVEVDLRLTRTRYQGTSRLVLTKVEERQTSLESARRT